MVPKGKKGDLQNMLKEIVEKQMPIIEGGPDKNSEALGGFPVGSKWKVLEHNADVVENPYNEFAFRAPTFYRRVLIPQPQNTTTTRSLIALSLREETKITKYD